METVRFELLGPLQLVSDRDGPRTISAAKIETLLAVLLIRANRPVFSEELISEIWGEERPRRARAGLHVYVSHLRKMFAHFGVRNAVIVTHPQGYLLAVDEALLDTCELRVSHARGRENRMPDPERALVSFSAASRLFRGPVLAGIGKGTITTTFVRWAEEMQLECLESIAYCLLRTGRHRELVGDLTNWVEEHPLHEAFREQLMLALHRSGRRAEALRVFQHTRRVLRDELGLEPGETMRRLQNAILNDSLDCAVTGQA
ncbi:AfsR/SARP family transcriptional regulator [Protofrankia coriariae]|uniref:AfsR/SARP family transcriptional regulator n=1 Tax=Protofrankia coriariae TaxID=1562887 RepID=UPI00069959F1|nr:AfsR/SARP family transcriptional regulator [Protofrankia coriariae]